MGVTVPSCSVGGRRQSWSYSLAMCDLTIFKSCIRPQPRRRARSKTKPHEAGTILALSTGHLLSSASSRGWGPGGEVENPGRQPTKRLLANGIKKYQNISKNFKNRQAWQMHSAGSPRTCGAALGSRSLSWRPGHCHYPLKTLRIFRQQGWPGHGWNCLSRLGTSGLRF